MVSKRTRTVGSFVASATLAAGIVGATSLPGRNSVDAGDLRSRSVGASEIQTNGVGKPELRGGSVGAAVRTGSVHGEEVDEATLARCQRGHRRQGRGRGTVGGKAAAQLGTRWALVAENGTIERQSGGFTIVNCYNANANCYLDAGEDVTNNGLHAQIVVANTDGSSILSAETGTAPCGAAFVACAPPGTERAEVLVVAPRASDGTVPGGVTPPSPANAARFYVFVTGSEG